MGQGIRSNPAGFLVWGRIWGPESGQLFRSPRDNAAVQARRVPLTFAGCDAGTLGMGNHRATEQINRDKPPGQPILG